MSAKLIAFRRLGRRRGVALASAGDVFGAIAFVFAFAGERTTFGASFGDFDGGETDALFGTLFGTRCAVADGFAVGQK